MLPNTEFISYLLALGACTILWSLFRSFKRQGTPRLPPGPRSLPILGNLRDFPAHGELDTGRILWELASLASSTWASTSLSDVKQSSCLYLWDRLLHVLMNFELDRDIDLVWA